MMNLHLDKDAFRVLIENIHEKTGYRSDVLEKDYYVVLVLEELAALQKQGLPVYFKGGTALYKALKTTNRFSEDIDLSVDTRNCSRTQSDKRLDSATKRYASLSRDPLQGKTNRSEVTSVYTYPPIVDYDRQDLLQRFGKLKVEATSFTISEPYTDMEVSAMIYDFAEKEQKDILKEQYDVKPFSVKTMTIERIFIDKLFAAEAYVRAVRSAPFVTERIEHRAFEAAKHIYDLSVMRNHPKIVLFLHDEEQMKKLLDIRTKEELERLDGVPNVSPCDFIFFSQVSNLNLVRKAYETMQNQYVLLEKDRIDFADAVKSLEEIHNELVQNLSWKLYQVPIRSRERNDDAR